MHVKNVQTKIGDPILKLANVQDYSCFSLILNNKYISWFKKTTHRNKQIRSKVEFQPVKIEAFNRDTYKRSNFTMSARKGVKKNKVATETELDLCPEIKHNLREVYTTYAEDDGLLIKDLKRAMLDILGYQPKDKEYRKILHDLKKKSEDSIVLDEFFNLMAPMMSEQNKEVKMKKVFETIDSENTGKIDVKDLKTAINKMGENINTKELKEVINNVTISFDDFRKIINKIAKK
ncbi:unnamed protein product [Callosobruchus maculatus]|uniref:EF-hand domain-containing protein n=1 Tax=Callosobruchus maculatus TaxID=64391 RepID=A0A653D4D4_CALMS|nr:unnamed protein product [Callosobruchus maculatus]